MRGLMNDHKKIPPWLKEAAQQQYIERRVSVVELLYRDEDTGFSAYMCQEDGRYYYRISGRMPFELHPEQHYWIEGKIVLYKETKQISVHTVTLEQPTSQDGMILMLQSLEGINKRAYTLFEHYGRDVFDILSQQPLRVANEISGISERQAILWSQQLKLIGGNFDLLAKLQSWGLSLNAAKKLIRELGQQVDTLIEANPYILARKVRGYGFKKCDAIALELAIDMKSKARLLAAIRYILQEASYEGHCYMWHEDLVERVKVTLDLPASEQYPKGVVFERAEINEQIASFVERKKLIEESGKIYLSEIYYAELTVAAQILRIMLHPATPLMTSAQQIDQYLLEKKLHLEHRQLEAVTLFSESTGGMYILNGSAGCGKTFTLNIILDILEQQYRRKNLPFEVKIFAPTGKAAKVAAKATGRTSSTVHRGLRYNPESGFEFNEKNPLPIDCLVLDESSMLDIRLAKQLFQAMPPHCKVIFMGDTKQLPSVGAGNVLHDLIASGMIPLVTLDVVKRQGKNSGIVQNAQQIIAGQPIQKTTKTEDAFVIEGEHASRIHQLLLRSIARLMDSKLLSLDDVQVLCPQRKGEAGTYVLNWLIQQSFNPYVNDDVLKVENCKFAKLNETNGEIESIGLYFIKGDKVIHTVNNYGKLWYIKREDGSYEPHPEHKGITNGECGVIEEILLVSNNESKAEDVVVVVRYEEGFVMYDDGVDELDHCYAMTIHKSQGSQWPAVLMVVMQEHYHMLNNSIFYTGYTRAKQFVCVFGQRQAIDYAITSFKHTERRSTLTERFIVSE